MNWEQIECERCGFTDYDDSMTNIERTEDGVFCATCRTERMLDYNEEEGYYE